MKAEQLRKAILQQAIQGKLVPQIDSDEPACELLEKIKEEKERLVKEKVIKKPKALPPITEEEKPFAIPESWEWVRLGEVTFNNGQKTPSSTFCYIDISSIDNTLQKIKPSENIIEPDEAPSRARKIVNQGDILYATVRPYLHNMCIVDRKFSCEPIASTGFAVLVPYKPIFNKYMFYYLLSPVFDAYANDTENSKGVAYPSINDKRLNSGIIPLPPLSEQHRIVARIEELMALVDVYEEKEVELSKLEAEFPEKLKKSLLQYAIQGKLLPQVDNDEPACALLEKIKEEKERLIKEKIIKKPKALPPITEEEKPFAIPESWEWVRLATICKSIADGDHQAPPQVVHGVPFIVISNLSSGAIDFSNTRYVPEEYFFKLSDERIAKNGDILFTVTGSYGISLIVSNSPLFCFQRHIALIKGCINNDFLLCLLKSPLIKKQCDLMATGTAQKTVGLTSLKNFTIPLPPLPEQQRIVARLEEMMGLVEGL